MLENITRTFKIILGEIGQFVRPIKDLHSLKITYSAINAMSRCQALPAFQAAFHMQSVKSKFVDLAANGSTFLLVFNFAIHMWIIASWNRAALLSQDSRFGVLIRQK